MNDHDDPDTTPAERAIQHRLRTHKAALSQVLNIERPGPLHSEVGVTVIRLDEAQACLDAIHTEQQRGAAS